MELLFSMMNYFLLILVALIGVAFITLFERKILGYIHIRKGPDVVGFWGVLQPLSDAVKLFLKEQVFLIRSNYYVYYFSPCLNMFLSLSCWLTLSFITYFIVFNFSVLFFMCCTALSVYSLLGIGWSSNSKYSLIGMLRCVAQTISYEVILALIFLIYVFISYEYSFYSFCIYQYLIWFSFLMFPLFMVLLMSSLAETNRSPFDFAEGESELVSGFNIEYSSGGFAIIFMAEYGSIIFMSSLVTMVLLGGSASDLMFFIKLGFVMYLFILLRGTLPRFRYDKLMFLCWKILLPVVLFLLYFFSVFCLCF